MKNKIITNKKLSQKARKSRKGQERGPLMPRPVVITPATQKGARGENKRQAINYGW